jgi:hypothetical protein
MRDDMSKVIVERARPGSSQHVARRSRRLDPKLIPVDEDADNPFPERIGHGRAASFGRFRKHLNENLAPLRRYLASQVGRPWDAVFSEISSEIRLDNAVQKHVRDHVDDFVAVTTFLQDGKIFIADRYGRPVSLADMRWPPDLYVHPVTGVLCRNDWRRVRRAQKRRAKAAKERALATRMRVLARDRQLHLLDDGNWWEVRLAAVPRYLVEPEAAKLVVDVIERAGLSALSRAERYDRRGVHATTMRALSRKEIKALGLRAGGRG